jgi:transposase
MAKRKPGRPTKYDPKKTPELAEKYAAKGYTKAEIAKTLKISISTLKDWQNQYPAFLAALKRADEIIDDSVEQKLYSRAQGYEYEEIVSELRDGEMVETKRIRKQLAPDTTAQIFWLKNRRRNQWRDRHDVGITGEVTVLKPGRVNKPKTAGK